ncbi:MAG: hypothetical protein ACRECH_05875, partial [Nitrososphaerales archaeon]
MKFKLKFKFPLGKKQKAKPGSDEEAPQKKQAKPIKQKKGLKAQPIEGPMVGAPIPKNFRVVERYPLSPPFAYAVVAEDPDKRLPYYFVDELELSEAEKELYSNIIATLQVELKAPRDDINPKKYFEQQA